MSHGVAIRRGFTLVELMVLIVIAGLVLGFGLPAFLEMKRSAGVERARQQLELDLEAARRTALTDRVPVIVSFDTAPSTSYGILTDRNGNGVPDTGEPRRACALPTRTRFSMLALQPADTVWFDSSGTLRKGDSGGWIMLESNGALDTLFVTPAGSVVEP
ncbi:MAG: Tfp pilus assembly protein FimT/FimU [Candidatus Eisenbacteria bacterium]